jgi:phage RecT family recombinase
MTTTKGARAPKDDQARETAVAVFDSAAAGKELAAAIEVRKPQLAALLGYEADSPRGLAMLDRFVTVALHAATRPEILRATKESLVEAIRDSAVLGLEPVGATGDGAIVIYNEKVKEEVPSPSGRGMIIRERSIPVAHFQPMYRGLLKLARRSAQIAQIDAHVVYQGDEITLDLGSDPRVVHYPVLDGTRRGDPIGAYAVAELANGRRYVEWMTYADIEAVRKVSRAGTSGPWVAFWAEMARKTVLRRLMKRLPLETMAEHAMRLEAEAEGAAAPTFVEAERPAGGGARERLRNRLGAGETETPPDPTDPPPPDGDAVKAPSDDSDPTVEAGATDPELSGHPSGGEAPTDQAADVVEGEVREIPETKAGTGDGFVVCGAEAPEAYGFEPGTVCVLETGHHFPDGKPTAHQDKGGSRWPATK